MYRLSSQSAALATKVPSLDAGSTFLLAGGAFLLIVFAFLLWRRAERRRAEARRGGAGQLVFSFTEPPPPPTWAAHDALAANAARERREEEFARVVAAADAEVELRAARPERLGARAATSDATGASGAPPATTARTPLPRPQHLLLLGMHRTAPPAVRASMPQDAPAASWAPPGGGAEAYDAASAPPGAWRLPRSGVCDGDGDGAYAAVAPPPGIVVRLETIPPASPRNGEAVTARNPLRVVPSRGLSGGRAAATGAETGDEAGDDDSGAEAGSGTGARSRVSAAAGLCVICLTAPATHVCVPCGHQCGCSECLEIVRLASRQCPLCRARIATVVRVFAAGASS